MIRCFQVQLVFHLYGYLLLIPCFYRCIVHLSLGGLVKVLCLVYIEVVVVLLCQHGLHAYYYALVTIVLSPSYAYIVRGKVSAAACW